MSGNSEFIKCWNEILVPKWNRFRHILSGNGKIHSDIALEFANLKDGDKVLDVGCGYGETCHDLSHIVGADGKVIGIDCTSAFIDIGQEELKDAKHDNIHYITGDAQFHGFEENEFDFAFSRFGVMFFENRVAALKNVHKALRPGGRLMLIVWRSLSDNYCWEVGKKIALKYLTPPEQASITCGPGPFSMANEEVSRGMLKSAGFSEIEMFKQNDVDVFMGSNIEEAIDFQILVGPSGELIRESGEKGQAALPAIRKDLKEELSNYLRGEEVWMPSSAWIIIAKK